jgi:tetratricopeptide (TPR) repeat protein
MSNKPLLLIFLAAAPLLAAQGLSPRLERGIALYGRGQWLDAAAELRRARIEAESPGEQGEALYWISLAEISAGEYEASLRDLDELLRINPGGRRSAEVPYEKGRALFHLGRYNEAIMQLSAYAGRSTDPSRKASALYWAGECLFSMGRLDEAEDIFSHLIDSYPQSVKYEASSYRLSLINQKKVEAELLKLLQWSHEESLKNMEEYQRRERTYDQALAASQKRITDMLKDTRLEDLEKTNAQYREQLKSAEERIRFLENTLQETSAVLENVRGSASAERLKFLKDSALELQGRIQEARK